MKNENKNKKPEQRHQLWTADISRDNSWGERFYHLICPNQRKKKSGDRENQNTELLQDIIENAQFSAKNYDKYKEATKCDSHSGKKKKSVNKK